MRGLAASVISLRSILGQLRVAGPPVGVVVEPMIVVRPSSPVEGLKRLPISSHFAWCPNAVSSWTTKSPACWPAPSPSRPPSASRRRRALARQVVPPGAPAQRAGVPMMNIHSADSFFYEVGEGSGGLQRVGVGIGWKALESARRSTSLDGRRPGFGGEGKLFPWSNSSSPPGNLCRGQELCGHLNILTRVVFPRPESPAKEFAFLRFPGEMSWRANTSFTFHCKISRSRP